MLPSPALRSKRYTSRSALREALRVRAVVSLRLDRRCCSGADCFPTQRFRPPARARRALLQELFLYAWHGGAHGGSSSSHAKVHGMVRVDSVLARDPGLAKDLGAQLGYHRPLRRVGGRGGGVALLEPVMLASPCGVSWKAGLQGQARQAHPRDLQAFAHRPPKQGHPFVPHRQRGLGAGVGAFRKFATPKDVCNMAGIPPGALERLTAVTSLLYPERMADTPAVVHRHGVVRMTFKLAVILQA